MWPVLLAVLAVLIGLFGVTIVSLGAMLAPVLGFVLAAGLIAASGRWTPPLAQAVGAGLGAAWWYHLDAACLPDPSCDGALVDSSASGGASMLVPILLLILGLVAKGILLWRREHVLQERQQS